MIGVVDSFDFGVVIIHVTLDLLEASSPWKGFTNRRGQRIKNARKAWKNLRKAWKNSREASQKEVRG